MSRRERIWNAGTRVRVDTPGYVPPDWWDGRGTVAMTTAAPDHALFILRDGEKPGKHPASSVFVCGSAEAARLKDQTANPDHQPPDGRWEAFWWQAPREGAALGSKQGE